MTPSILFYVNDYEEPKKADYQHTVIALADGFKKLNIDFDSNINFYKLPNGEYLFKKKENIDHQNYKLIITGFTCGTKTVKPPYDYKSTLIPMEVLKNPQRKYKTVMLDWSDGLMTYISNHKLYDYYFITSYHSGKIKNIGNNIYPLAFYATERIIKATSNHLDFEKRLDKVFYSHRINHVFRQMSRKIYQKENFIRLFNDNFKQLSTDSEDYLNWCQTGRRHNPAFYLEMGKSKIVDCVGGCIRSGIASQIDSFKLWEGFFSKCCVITMDFDHFKITLPSQPVNMKHYIGLTTNIQKNIEIIRKIKRGEIDIKQIAEDGYKWAVENYSPCSLAKYINSIVD